ncbi:hypothetical protein H109_07033 [Trichophyton interdigitale MR816]|uniref:Uncharacterized protein n=1 Tax=Trichophyton interdigitale (strain MR816) TaxID=1215338 RepID=A0A059IZR4_TRIIM|nr:hypothetical protein H109_07033 [Trichophyton interdigitale MR816]
MALQEECISPVEQSGRSGALEATARLASRQNIPETYSRRGRKAPAGNGVAT